MTDAKVACTKCYGSYTPKPDGTVPLHYLPTGGRGRMSTAVRCSGSNKKPRR